MPTQEPTRQPGAITALGCAVVALVATYTLTFGQVGVPAWIEGPDSLLPILLGVIGLTALGVTVLAARRMASSGRGRIVDAGRWTLIVLALLLNLCVLAATAVLAMFMTHGPIVR